MRDEEGKRKGFDRPRDSYLERDDLSELDWQDKQLAAVDARLLRETPGAAPETGRLAMQTDRTAGGEQPDAGTSIGVKIMEPSRAQKTKGGGVVEAVAAEKKLIIRER